MGRADVSHGRRLVRKSRARRSPADDFVAQQKCAANATGVLSYFRTYYVVFVRSYCLHVRHGTRLTPRGRRKKFRVDRDRQYLAAYPSLAPVSLRGAPHGSPQVLSRWCVFSSRFHAFPSFSLAVAAAARATIASARVSGVSDLAREGNLCARARGRWGFARASRRRRRRATPRASRRDAAPRVATPRRRRIHDSTPSPSRARRPRRPQRAGFLGFRPFLFPRARGRLDGNPPSRAPQVRRRGVDIASASR